MTTYRDRLPLGKPAYIGLPFHGLVTNETLDLPNDKEIEIPFTGHQTVLVRAEDAEVPEFTVAEAAFNTAQGYTWQDFAILYGINRTIGGQALGAQSYLYHDGAHAWIIDVELSGADLALTIKLYLRQIFGFLDDSGQAPTMPARRKLDELEFTPVQTGGTAQTEAQSSYNRYLFMTHSQTGATTAANIAVSRGEEYASDFGIGFAYQFGGNGYVVHNALQIAISGTGAISGIVGSGIVGAITMLANAQEMDSYASTTTGDLYSDFRDTHLPEACQTDYSFTVPGCTSSVQYYDAIDTRKASWVGSECGGYDPPYIEDDTKTGVRSTTVASRHFVAVSKAGVITWLETATETTNNWSASATSAGSLTVTRHWSMAALPSCSQTMIGEEWSGSNSWTLESTQVQTVNAIVRFGGEEYTQSVSRTYHSLEEWYMDDAFATGGVATKVTNQTIINEDSPGYVESCSSGGFVTVSCSGVYDDGWYCPAAGAIGGVTMVEPQVWRFQAQGSCGGTPTYAYRLVTVNGESLGTYTDAAGPSARLVSYNPETGELSIAAAAADLVSWV